MRAAVLILVISTGACAAQAPVVCPWLSTGSAEAVLGGSVTLSARVEGIRQGNCRFTRESQGRERTISIVIGKEDTHGCPQGSASLAALGNEAVQCTSHDAQGQRLDMIAGRVRDVYFVVGIGNVLDATTIPAAPASPSTPFSASILERITEQVVGNLY